jgi:hypothetical protein
MEDLPYVFFGSDDDDWNKDEEGESAQILQCGHDFTYECTIKGTMPWDFRLQVFFMNQFSPSPWVFPQGRFRFLRKFAEIFAPRHPCWWHWWQMKQIFKKKSLNIFVWTPLGSRVNIRIKFFLQDNLKQSDVVTIICHRCHWHRWQFAACVKFISGIINTGGATWLANTSEN